MCVTSAICCLSISAIGASPSRTRENNLRKQKDSRTESESQLVKHKTYRSKEREREREREKRERDVREEVSELATKDIGNNGTAHETHLKEFLCLSAINIT